MEPIDPQPSEDETRRDFGVDPETAAIELRTILGASGEGQGIIAQCRALEIWAEDSRRKLGPGFDLSEARLGGLEHYVWNDEQAKVVRKVTYGGCFGRTVRTFSIGLVPATPLEYLDRWAAHNARFGQITRLSGVLCKRAEPPAIAIEQDALPGDLPSTAHVENFMRS